jgi:hypothetical protein
MRHKQPKGLSNTAKDLNLTAADIAAFEAKSQQKAARVEAGLKLWEKKSAKTAAKGAGFTAMAVSLAACGSSSSDDAVVVLPEPEPTPEPTPTPTLSALQAQIATLFTASIAETEATQDLKIAAAGSPTFMSIANTTTAPAEITEADDSFDAVTTFLDNFTDVKIYKGTTELGTVNTVFGLADLDITPITDFDDLVSTLSIVDAASGIVTAASRKAALDARELIEANVTLLDSQFSLAVTTTKNALDDNATGTAAQKNAALASIDAIATTLAKNFFAELSTPTTSATDAQETAGIQAFANQLLTAALAIAPPATALTAAQRADALGKVVEGIGETPTGDLGSSGTDLQKFLASDFNLAKMWDVFVEIDSATGVVTSVELLSVAFSKLLEQVVVEANKADSVTLIDSSASILNESIFGDIIGDEQTVFDAYVAAVLNKAAVDEGISIWNAIYEVILELAELEAEGSANNIEVLKILAENPDLNLIEDGAGTIGDDVAFFSATFSDSGLALTDFGAEGTDMLFIAGEYTFVEISKADVDGGLQKALGDSAALEIFYYETATGNLQLFIERDSVDGSVQSANILKTVTIEKVAFDDLSVVVADGFTVLSSEAAIV